MTPASTIDCARAVEHAEQSLNCATRTPATSRSSAERRLLWYTVSIIWSTVAAISGRSANTRRPSDVVPCGIWMRAMHGECTTTCPPLAAPDVVDWPGDQRGSGAPSRRPDHPGTDRELRRSAPGMATALLRVLRHLPPRARRRRWRDDEPGVPRHHQPPGRGRRARPDGDGDHPLHGPGLGRAPQPGREHRVRAPQRLPVAAGPGLRRRAARGRHARRASSSSR